MLRETFFFGSGSVDWWISNFNAVAVQMNIQAGWVFCKQKEKPIYLSCGCNYRSEFAKNFECYLSLS